MPVSVDLDGTLLRTDLLFELLARVLRQKPWLLLMVPLWRLGGRSRLYRELGRRVSLDPATLPYNGECLDWLRRQKAFGQTLVLVTAGEEELARRVAAHLGIFHDVRAGDGSALESAKEFLPARTRIGDYLSALRIHQWAKNVLGFAPLVTSHEIFHLELVWRCTLSMLLFGLCSSAQYIVNDLVDLETDRRHPTKRLRPFAAGTLPLQAGFVLAPLLLIAGLAGALALSGALALTLAGYTVAALAYSLYLKKPVLVDVFVLSGLLLLRVIAGQIVTGVVYSVWLLSFGYFLLLSLAFAKRCAELSNAGADAESLAGRGYQVSDLPQVNAFGVCSAFLAAVVFMLYLQSDRVRELYRSPDVLWLWSPLFLYWITRAWILSSRGRIHEDPVMFVLKDRPTWWVAFLAVLIMALAGAKSWSGR